MHETTVQQLSQLMAPTKNKIHLKFALLREKGKADYYPHIFRVSGNTHIQYTIGRLMTDEGGKIRSRSMKLGKLQYHIKDI